MIIIRAKSRASEGRGSMRGLKLKNFCNLRVKCGPVLALNQYIINIHRYITFTGEGFRNPWNQTLDPALIMTTTMRKPALSVVLLRQQVPGELWGEYLDYLYVLTKR
ncbi:hypothetical protein PoB_000229500 [Plakobranchus ocellatus]|uniref:Uncharacterized protein n=1 Tax=Plakobranchus ocellatus TaxID=259542 RepID=A0AAV3XZ99_9GAST|nr:hypothetical protein PoB_000229500 [Plakobranchus ocellatus]